MQFPVTTPSLATCHASSGWCARGKWTHTGRRWTQFPFPHTWPKITPYMPQVTCCLEVSGEPWARKVLFLWLSMQPCQKQPVQVETYTSFTAGHWVQCQQEGWLGARTDGQTETRTDAPQGGHPKLQLQCTTNYSHWVVFISYPKSTDIFCVDLWQKIPVMLTMTPWQHSDHNTANCWYRCTLNLKDFLPLNSTDRP